MVGIYHSRDLDGYCSGAILKHKFPDIKLIGYDYGEEFDFDKVLEGEDVIMVDVSMPMDKMSQLADKSMGKFTWIDHHISAKKEYEGSALFANPKITPVIDTTIAACEIAWDHFFPDLFRPTSVMLLGKYDSWRNVDKYEWDNAVMPFQYGMRMICSSPETFPPELFKDYMPVPTDSPVYSIIHDGKLILQYQKMQNERAAKSAFEVDFMGKKAIALNIGGGNSMMFESVYDPSKHDLMMPFFYTGRQWVVSIYTTKDEIDCSVLAKANGGGGHKKAAGFQLPAMPEFLKK